MGKLPEARCPGCGRPTRLDEDHEPVACNWCVRAAHDINEELLEFEEEDQW